MMKKSRKKKVMVWVESQYPVLAEVFKTTQTADSFHLAEENKKEFPHDDAVKVTEEMAGKLLSNGEHDQNVSLRIKDYLKSMFLCVTPESLTPLATLMYQRFEKTCPLQMVFEYEDEKKVTQLCICLFVRGLLSDEAQQICKKSNEKVIVVINKEIVGTPNPAQLLAASKTADSEVQRSLYSAYRGWKEIPQTDAEHITEAMAKHLKGADDEREAFLDSLFFSLHYHTLLPLAVTMFQKYREVCPDKLGLLKSHKKKRNSNWEVSTQKGRNDNKWNTKLLGRVLVRRNVLTKEEYGKFTSVELISQLDRTRLQNKRQFERHDLCEVFDDIWEKEPYGCDLVNYKMSTEGYQCLPYDDAVAISNLMLRFLNGDKQQRKIYVKAMNIFSHRRKYWRSNIAVATKNHDPDDESLMGEYNNVAVIMCQQYLDKFPESYSELGEYFSPQYMYLLIVKCMWQRNILSEVAMNFCVQSILMHHQRDELTIFHGLIPLLRSLPTTVYIPALVMSEVSDFSESIWIQSSHDFNQEDFMKILVAGAIAREEKSLPNDASYQVLVKAIKNKKSTAMKVELILDVLLPQLEVQPQDCDLWDPPECKSDSEPLYLLAARRGSQFINVAFKLLEYLESNFNYRRHKKNNSRVMQLIKCNDFVDYTVANIISKMIECKTITFDDQETVDLAECCSSYTGKGSRVHTATMLWKSYSHLLNFLINLLSAAENEDVPFAILEEFNIDLNPDQSKAQKSSNALHVAAEKGFTKFVELALDRGFAKLLDYSNEEEQFPVQVALKKEHYGTAAVMLRAMNDYELCLQDTERSQDSDFNSPDSPDGDVTTPDPRVKFRDLLDQLKDLEGKDSAEDLQDCVMAILDSTVDRDRSMIHHEVLEADCKGNTPDKEDFNCPEMHSIEFIMKHKEHLQDIINHESFQSLVNHKWKRYGLIIFLIPFVTYLFFLTFLTTVFVLGASKSGSPFEYNQPVDWFRLFCEIVVLLLTIIDILFEVYQFYHIVHITCNIWKAFKAYFTDWTNWLENIAIFLTLLIIPFRIADLDVQWVFVALAYILHTLRIFKYAAINSSFFVYVKTLFQIIKRDIGQFVAVFIVIIVSFGGGLYFSLRADTCRLPADRVTTDEIEFSPVNNTSLCLHPDETSEIYLSWLTGFRLLIEGNVIDSYIFGDRGFWWVSVMIYMIFLFLVAVIMLNLLIAQFSKSYEEVTKCVRKTVTPDRAKILVELQSTRWKRWCCNIITLNRKDWGRGKFMSALKFYKKSSMYKKSDDETVNDFEKIRKQLSSSKSTDQKQFKEMQAQLNEVKAALHKQTEIAVEQQRQIKESLKSLGEMDILQRVLQK